MVQVLNQDETPLLYSLVFGEGVVNDATSVVLFNAIQSFDLTHIDSRIALHFMGNFLYLFFTSTMLGVFVSTCLYSVSIYTRVLYCFHFLYLGITSLSCRRGCSVLTLSKSFILAGNKSCLEF